MAKLLIQWIVSSVLIYFTAWLLPGVHAESLISAFWVSLLLGLINIFIKPILVIFSFPFILLSFGLFLWIINACLLMFVSWWVESFYIDSFLSALLASGIISIGSLILDAAINSDDK